MRRERVVFDTNVLISGALSTTSTPALALEHCLRNAQLLASTVTLRELMEKLPSTKFDQYVSRDARDALLLRLAPLLELVEIVQSVRASRDPKDDKFLDVAVNGRADVLVTGDRDLLELNPFRGIAILTPADYLTRRGRRSSFPSPGADDPPPPIGRRSRVTPPLGSSRRRTRSSDSG